MAVTERSYYDSWRARYGLIQESTLNHSRDPHVIQGIIVLSGSRA